MATTNGGNGTFKPVFLALYFIGVVVSGGGANYLYLRNIAPDTIAPDRFTGTQGKVIESRLASLEYHIRNHPDTTGRFDSRITGLEAQMAIIISNQNRILTRLDGG